MVDWLESSADDESAGAEPPARRPRGESVMDHRVGFAATSVLEELCREAITDAWVANDYSRLTEYISNYERLRWYNARAPDDRRLCSGAGHD